MSELLERLERYGADVEGAMGRFLEDHDLYGTCFSLFLKEDNFEKLGIALSEKDYTEAFEAAHTLKGVAGNMGLTPIYDVICTMVENLRSQDYSHVTEQYEEIMENLEQLKKLQ
ncbi:MAG: Hpt domain-containing protein [Clostridium sp.]